MTSGIYKITNLITDKIYIGSSADIEFRFYNHKRELKNKKHKNSYFQNAWNKYGLDNFKFEVIEYCQKEKLIDREQYWIDLTKCYERNIGYNICPIAKSVLGIKRSEETKKKMSTWQIGRKLSDEVKQKLKDAWKTRIVSEETKLKISIASKGKKHSEETKAKMRGRKHTEEALIKMRVKRSPETKARMSLAFKGRICSEETKRKMSIAVKERHRLKKNAAIICNVNNV